jgi:heme exporter protein A
LTAAENLAFYARLYQLDNSEERVINALKRVGLAARQRDPVRSFSRGMVQRLTLARATLHEPDVLLFDEPYTGLDQEATMLLDDLLRAEADKGRTIFMITHDLTRGLNLCDRIVILSRGKIAHAVDREDATPSEFLHLYSDSTRGTRRKRRRREKDF